MGGFNAPLGPRARKALIGHLFAWTPPSRGDTDTMVASLFRAVGLSFKDVGFMKFNLWSPPMAAAAHYSLIMYLKSPISTTVLEKLPVSVDKVRCPLA